MKFEASDIFMSVIGFTSIMLWKVAPIEFAWLNDGDGIVGYSDVISAAISVTVAVLFTAWLKSRDEDNLS